MLNITMPAVARRTEVFRWYKATNTDVYPESSDFTNADGEDGRNSRITVTTVQDSYTAPLIGWSALTD